MGNELTKEEVLRQLDELKASAILEACWNCECFQGFLAQLEIDMEEDCSAPELEDLRVERSSVHACLGCDPCPPAEVYSTYLKARSKAKEPDDSPAPCDCSMRRCE